MELSVDESVVKPSEGVFVSVKKASPKKTWKALSQESTSVVEEAVNVAVSAWGRRCLAELEAEERRWSFLLIRGGKMMR
ncbi:hypothetical protein Tco_1534883 [Tanacetum coccineum]